MTEQAAQIDLLNSLGGKLVSQGAEARVFEVRFLQRDALVKERFVKAYRHPALDEKLTTKRISSEARGLLKARKLGLRTPALYFVDVESRCLYMEKVQGCTVKNFLQTYASEENAPIRHALLRKVGEAIATLHDGGVIHGDLTTSNLMVEGHELNVTDTTNVETKLVLIDFGLSYNSTVAEDKGVDLYVLERAFRSTHAASEDEFEHVLDGYKRTSKQWSATFNRFAEVRLRGRKRLMVG
mmetsp:Transcript_11599/g.42422  ORF Transcript_11599/g.42422 Transcript_11599/m.42422 type:complete len:240 (+) Transcript_11599:139-858(+)